MQEDARAIVATIQPPKPIISAYGCSALPGHYALLRCHIYTVGDPVGDKSDFGHLGSDGTCMCCLNAGETFQST